MPSGRRSPKDLPPKTKEAAESLRGLLRDLETREGVLDRRFYVVCRHDRAGDMASLLSRVGLFVQPSQWPDTQECSCWLAPWAGHRRDLHEDKPVEVEINRRDLRIGGGLTRSLHLGRWPRTLAPGFLQALMNSGIPMDLSVHLAPISAEQAARTPGVAEGQVRGRPAPCPSARAAAYHPEAEIALEDVTRLRDEVQRGRERLFHSSLSHHPLFQRSQELEGDDPDDEGPFRCNPGQARRHYHSARGRDSSQPCPSTSTPVALWRTLDTSSLARLFPFSPPDMDTRSGTLYGLDLRARSPIVYDPWDGTHLNANTAVLARSGSGKSFATKLGVLRGLCRGITAYVIDPEGEYANMARAAGGRGAVSGRTGPGHEPLRHGPEGPGGAAPAHRQPEEADRGHGGGEARCRAACRPRPRPGRLLRRGQGAHRGSGTSTAICRAGRTTTRSSIRGGPWPGCCGPSQRAACATSSPTRGDDLLHNEALVTVFRPEAAGAGAETRSRHGLHRDGVGRCCTGPQAEAACGGRGVEHHAAPRGGGVHGLHGQEGPQTQIRPPVHYPGRAGPAQRGHLPHHHRPLWEGPAAERRLQAAAPAGRRSHQHRGRGLRPARGPAEVASLLSQGRRASAGQGATGSRSASRPPPRRRTSSSGGRGATRDRAHQGKENINATQPDEAVLWQSPLRPTGAARRHPAPVQESAPCWVWKTCWPPSPSQSRSPSSWPGTPME